MTTQSIKFFLVDDQPGYRRIVKKFLESNPSFELNGEASPKKDFLYQVKSENLDVIFVDIYASEKQLLKFSEKNIIALFIHTEPLYK